MDRLALKSFTHNAKDFLSVSKNDYKQWVFRYTFLELEKDLGVVGDVTSQSIFKEEDKCVAKVVARESGILCGMDELKYFLVDSDPRFRPRVSEFDLKVLKNDGDTVRDGDVVCEIRGKTLDVLAVERVCLNLVMRMSGVATATYKIVSVLKSAQLQTLVTPTRKTLWGLLDKRACVVGGGGTHRLNLNDAVLIKDNHIKACGGSATIALQRVILAKPDCRFIEIEVESGDEAMKVAETLVSYNDQKILSVPCCIMFDNMKPADIDGTLSAMKKKNYYEKILFEASGGINKDNIILYAKTGVDIVSMGGLTTGARSLDFSLEFT